MQEVQFNEGKIHEENFFNKNKSKRRTNKLLQNKTQQPHLNNYIDKSEQKRNDQKEYKQNFQQAILKQRQQKQDLHQYKTPQKSKQRIDQDSDIKLKFNQSLTKIGSCELSLDDQSSGDVDRSKRYDVEQQEVHPQSQAIITQNVAFSLPQQNIQRPYLIINIFLLFFYSGVGVIAAFKILYPSMSPLPLIVIVSFNLIGYIVYIFGFLKYSRIKLMMKKVLNLKYFAQILQQMRQANTYFKVTLKADTNKPIDKAQIRQLIYDPVINDVSGKLYELPYIINHCKKQTKSNDTKQVERNKSSQNHKNKNNSQNVVSDLSAQGVSIVFAKYNKKYFFSNQNAKIDYLNSIQQFFTLNKQMIDPTKQFKGYKRIQYIVQKFHNQKAFIMVNNKTTTTQKHINEQKQWRDFQNNIFTKRSPNKITSFSGTQQFQNNYSNAIIVLDEDDVKMPQLKPKQGLIYKKHKKQPSQIVEKQNKLFQTKNNNNENISQESKYITILYLFFWITLILGFGSFFQIFLLRNYIKRIQINITKQITNQKK